MNFFKWLRDLDANSPRHYSISDMMADDVRGKPRPPGFEPKPRPAPELAHRLPELIRDERCIVLRPHSVFFGGRVIPISELRHMLIAGTTGSGKSLQLLLIIGALAREVVPGSGNRLMIVGSKDDAWRMLSGMKVPHLVLNIEDPESPGWDIAADYDDPLLIEELAHILIPPAQNDEEFWDKTARGIVAGLMLSYQRYHGSDWRFSDVFNATMGSFEDLITILEQHPNNRALVALLQHEEIAKTNLNLMITVISAMRRLLPFAIHCQNAKHLISIRRDFLQSETIWLIQPSADRMHAITPVVQAMFRAVTEKLSALPEQPDRRTFIALDEAQYLGKIPGVDKFVEFTRSQGGRLFLATQSIEGLCQHYGELGGKNLLGLFPYKSILRMDTAASIEWAQKCFGSVEVWEKSVSRSRSSFSITESENYSLQVRSRLLDSDVSQLPLAHPKMGIHAFYSIPKAPDDDPDPKITAYRYNTPGALVEQLKPPMAAVPLMKSKIHRDFELKPWTKEEWMKFVRPADRDSYEYYRALARARVRVIEQFIKDVFTQGS